MAKAYAVVAHPLFQTDSNNYNLEPLKGQSHEKGCEIMT
jgi:hypothetical protein